MVDCIMFAGRMADRFLHCDERNSELRKGKAINNFMTDKHINRFVVAFYPNQAVYFTSLFPYVVLTIFFIRGITLEGAGAGLIHMYTPKVEKLLEPTVWLDAATQVFYSFGLAFGSLIAFGSYNTPKNNCVRDVLLVSFCNAVTAIYASVVIFAILGYKATKNVEKCFEA